jgi:hypothetical protein
MLRFYGAGKAVPNGDIKPSEFPAAFRMTIGRHLGRVGFVCSLFPRPAVVLAAVPAVVASFVDLHWC